MVYLYMRSPRGGGLVTQLHMVVQLTLYCPPLCGSNVIIYIKRVHG
jgi:hypothetical protein